MVFEIFLVFFGSIFLILVILKYFQMKNRLTLYILLIFLFYILTIFFSMISKVIVLTTEYDYVYNQPSGYPESPYSWIILRIVDFRISLALAVIGVYFSYKLKINIFKEEISRNQKIFITVFAGFSFFFSIFVYQRGNTLLDALNFLFILLFMSIVYFPFMLKCLHEYRTAAVHQLRGRFLSLALMSLNFMLVTFCFLIDRVLVLMGWSHFTIFYFLGWSSALFGIACAYIGYVKPT